ncbi:MAG: SEC-C domain-containing protein [Nanoarchaeota archaeon]
MLKKKNKLGRNDKCPCGSGRKFKKCHLGKEMDFTSVTVDQKFQEMKTQEHQRREQQGLGREIISIKHKGQRFVAVGSKLYSSKNWNTFHDFLTDYIKNALGIDWGNDQLKKDFKERHPILHWYQYFCELKQKNKIKTGEITSVPHIGASIAYLGLANNLYLLRHNVGVQPELIRRVKLDNIGNFYGAVYETYVAAHFVKAGFNIEFENELDGSTSHCEFIATYKETGRKFSVEAKAIAPKRKGRPSVVKKLNDALKKVANYDRIVFIDIGKPAGNLEESKQWLLKVQKEIRKHEKNPILNGVNLPKAYVIITNNSYWYDLQGQNFNFSALGEGFQISSFKDDYKDTIRNALVEREKHKEVFGLLESMHKHQEIPSTFDGENPVLALNTVDDENSSLVIGHKYFIPTNDGSDVVATLEHVVVDEAKKLAVGSYSIEGGGSTILTCPLSDIELAAYKKHPNTFFGKVTPKTKLESPLEFYDWVYSMYENTPKERLLEFMNNHPNQGELKKLSQEELLRIYCEGVTETASCPKED